MAWRISPTGTLRPSRSGRTLSRNCCRFNVRVETVYRAADDQTERAKLYREYHEATLRNPRYVGAHWFQWWDQVLTARCDGENFPCGFLSITDTPYRELVEAARDIARRMYALKYGRGR